MTELARSGRFIETSEIAATAVAILDLDASIIEVNAEFERLTGLDPVDIVGHPLDEIWAFDAGQSVQSLAEAIRDDGTVRVVAEARRPDQGVPDVCLRFILLTGPDKASCIGVQVTPSAVIKRNHDISMDWKCLQLSFDQLEVGMLITGLDGFVVQANESICRLLGRTRQELAELDIFSTVHPDERQQDMDLGLAAFAGHGDTWTREKRLIRKDGSIIWVLESAILVRDESGEPLHFQSQFVDVTARRQAEVARDTAEAAVRQSEAKLKFLADGIPVALVEIAATGEILNANPALTELLGCDPLGRSAIDLIHPRDRERVATALGDAIAKRDDWTVEFRALRSDNTTRRVRAHIRLHFDGDEFTAATSSWADVTEEFGAKEASERLTNLLRVQATTDPLTGVANRASLNEALKDALERATPQRRVAILFVDLDRFKAVNDQWGHDVGDDVLVDVARRLMLCVREGDTVARLGGDEFVVLTEGISEPDALRLGDRIVRSIGQPFRVGSTTVEIGASVGLAMGDDTTPQDLLRSADTAVYRAKGDGRARMVAA